MEEINKCKNCRENKEFCKICPDCDQIQCFDCIRKCHYEWNFRKSKDGNYVAFKGMNNEELSNYDYKCDNCFGCRDCRRETDRSNCKDCIDCKRLTCFDCIKNMIDLRGRQVHKFRNMSDDDLKTYHFKCKECFHYHFFAAINCKISGEIKILSSVLKLDYYPNENEIIVEVIKQKERGLSESKIYKISNTATLISYSQLSDKQYRNF